MQQIHPAGLASESLLAECEERRQRRSGPGGQHRNKVETGVVLTHRPTGVVGQAFERRSQEANRRQALFRLRVQLALEVRCLPPESAGPSARWRSRVAGGRIIVSPTHDDFPAMLAEALDRIVAADDDVKAAAEQLGCSTSQLVKLLGKEPRALELVNGVRLKRGQRPLRPPA